jgi:predicted DNA-binding mobile mystery protein A
MIQTTTSPLARQLDTNLRAWRAITDPRPSGGWLRAIRQALGMTTRQLARSLGVTQAAVVDAERTEARGDITLTTLQRYATALGCEVRYALVPKRRLREMIEDRAEKIARDQIERVSHSMALEDQTTDPAHWSRQVAQLRRKLLEGRLSRLWQ